MEQESSSWWLRRWLKSEMFWQGITAQTLGTLIAAVILALVAIFVGVGYAPAVRYFVIYGLVILLSIFLEIVIAVFIARFLEKAVSRTRLYNYHPFLTAVLLSPLALFALFVTWNGAILSLLSFSLSSLAGPATAARC